MSDSSKVKGVVDIVVLLDISGSMQPCIDAVKTSISAFISQMSATDANNDSPVKDWRMKVVGYRDHQADPSGWFVDNPFVREVAAVQAQLNASGMRAAGGGDEPESLLDALYTLAKMDQCGVQDTEDANKWRARGHAARAVIFFTDATYKTPMTVPGAAPGNVDDLIKIVMDNKLIVFGFIPEWSGYLEDLGCLDKAQFEFVATVADHPAIAGLGKPGAEGNAAMTAAVNAMRAKVADPVAFTKLMVQLAKTVSKSAVVETAEC